MKLKYIFPLIIAALAFMVSCQDEDTMTLLDEIQVSSSYVSLPVDGGSASITVTAKDSYTWAPKNLQQPLSLDILAKKSNISRRTFTRRFRETTGSTVTQWLNTERVCRAQQLLETTNLSIERISSEAGFSSALTMRQQFSKQLGTTPSAYRQNFYKQPDWPESI